MMTCWTNIAERLRADSEPDHAIDIAIARQLGVTVMRRNDGGAVSIEDTYWRYTEKIDDALSLIPPSLFYIMGYGRVRSGEPLCGVQILRPVTGDVVAEAEADTLPIAICMAALAVLAKGEERA